MKKFIYSFMVLTMALFTFSACSSDDEEVVGPQNPETEVAGTYVGNWVSELRNSSGELQSTKTAENATIVITAEKQWVAKVTLNVADPVVKTEASDVANCSGNSTSGYKLTNGVGEAFGNFSARVSADNTITFIYQTTVKEGRKTYTATNVFTGTKQ